MAFYRSRNRKRLEELMSLTLTAIDNLTSAVDTLSANLPTGGDADDATNAALVDAQTARILALVPGSTPPVDGDGNPVVAPVVETPAVVLGAGGAEKTAANPHGQV